ncbi:MAG: hypothetical protein IPP14_15510 [Planctomycetes bacterium]|nr:hypothetical protein [Planctomycetota bacterium]
MTNEPKQDPFELITDWKRRAQAWLHLAATWEGTLLALRSTGAPVPESLVVPMREQAQQLLTTLNPPTTPDMGTREARPSSGEPTDAYLLHTLRDQLGMRNRRPQDLQNILGVAKDAIERLLAAHPDLFEKLDQGWWKLK